MSNEPAPRQRRILVVDDNRDAADALATLLRSHHQLVRQAYDGPTAVLVAEEFRPEIVFLDLVMPGTDGFAVAQSLRRLERMHTARTVLVALSARAEPAFVEASAEAGFDTHLRKPASAEVLLGVLALN